MLEEDPTYYQGPKTCIFQKLLGMAPSDYLKELLQWEDVVITNYEKKFPGTIFYKWEDVQAVENYEQGTQ
jgi:hypothetical protein